MDYYRKVSGQFVNFSKSKIQVSKRVSNAGKREIARILQINSSNTFGTYLGYSNIDKKRRTREDFDNIERRLRQKIGGLESNTYFAGNTVLIKSNLTDITQYSINWFKIPICPQRN